MTDVNLSQITVSLVAAPSGKPRTSPPHSISQSAAVSPAEAHGLTSFAFSEPSFVPAGFQAVDAVHLSGDVELVVISYGGPNGRITLVQGPLHQYQAGADGVRRYFVAADNLRSAEVAGAPAAVAEKANQPSGALPSLNLVWENGELIGHILAQGVSEDELALVASSLS